LEFLESTWFEGLLLSHAHSVGAGTVPDDHELAGSDSAGIAASTQAPPGPDDFEF
jgi:hypothetical protein